MRLGEAMVKEGLITNDLLAKALERQIIFGGRLGTNLVEMGAINEETLARFLSRVLRVPYAEPASFEDVPQEVLDGMPRELAERYTAFPIKRERSRLHLAMKDPNDISVLDELRFIVGLDIKPYIASEMRIVFALEKYYGIKRDLRYVAVQGAEDTFDKHLDVPSAKSGHSPAPVAQEDEYLGDESQTEINVTGLFGEPAPAQPQLEPEPQPPAAPSLAAQGLKPPALQYPAQPAAAPTPPVQPVAPPAAPEPREGQPKAAPARSPYQTMASPGDREEIAEAVVEAAMADVSRAALFMVKGQALTGWRARGAGLSDKAVSSVQLNLTEPTLFKDVVEDKIFYKGPILQIPQNLALMEKLGGEVPLEAVAYPLVIKGKVVGVLYGDNGRGSMVTGNLERLGSLMAKASMSLEILILKTKILAGE